MSLATDFLQFQFSRDRGEPKASEAEMEFSSRGRARGRAALRDDGISTSAGASIARLDQANEKRHCCKESGCDRTFQTKVSYFGSKLFRN